MRALSIAATALAVAMAALMVVSLQRSSMLEVIICSTDNTVMYIPSSLCKSYLYNFRGNSDDIAELKITTGITIAFDIRDQTQRKQLFEFLLNQGLEVNTPNTQNGLYPLQAAILRNDLDAVKLLLDHGANPALKNKRRGLDSLEFMHQLIQRKPEINRKPIERILTRKRDR